MVLEKTLESPLDCKEIKPVNPKGNQLFLFIGRTNAEALILWPNLMQWANSLEKTLMLGKIEGRRRRGQKRTRWPNGISNLMDMTLSKLWELVKDREAWCATSTGLQRVTEQQHSLEPSPTSWPVHVFTFFEGRLPQTSSLGHLL